MHESMTQIRRPVEDTPRSVLNSHQALTLIDEARLLLSVDGENPEYDRAIAELTTVMLGGTSDDKETVLGFLRILQ